MHATTHRPDPSEYGHRTTENVYPRCNGRQDRCKTDDGGTDGIDCADLRDRDWLADHSEGTAGSVISPVAGVGEGPQDQCEDGFPAGLGVPARPRWSGW